MDALAALHLAAGASLERRNGRHIPVTYAMAEAAHHAVRNTIVLSDYSHLSKYLIEGPQAFEYLDHVLSGEVGAIRDQQGLFTLLLDEDGLILSDCYLLNDEERYLLLAEHIDDAELGAWLERHRGAFEVSIQPQTETLACLLFEGPYAWELMAEMFGRDVTGMPFMEFAKPKDDTYLFRCGKHGEYAFKVICPAEDAAPLWQEALAAGAKYDLVPAGLELQGIIRLENVCWHAPRFAAVSRDPVELQMQWMIRYDKDEFIGKKALAARRPHQRRLTAFVAASGEALAPGDGLFHNTVRVGDVIDAAHSKFCDSLCGLAILDLAYAYASLDDYHAVAADGRTVPVRTHTIPFLANYSFAVNPAIHSYVNPAKHRSLLEQLAAEAPPHAANGR